MALCGSVLYNRAVDAGCEVLEEMMDALSPMATKLMQEEKI
jgi:hypothetical protein